MFALKVFGPGKQPCAGRIGEPGAVPVGKGGFLMAPQPAERIGLDQEKVRVVLIRRFCRELFAAFRNAGVVSLREPFPKMDERFVLHGVSEDL